MHIPPVIQLAFWAGIAWGIHLLVPALDRHFTGQQAVAQALYLAGLAVAIAGMVEFARARTTINPVAPEQASRVVATGIYRFTRNPMYLGMAMLLAGAIVWFGNPLGAIALPGFILGMTMTQIAAEEAALSAKFGDDYGAYKGRVRRWL